MQCESAASIMMISRMQSFKNAAFGMSRPQKLAGAATMSRWIGTGMGAEAIATAGTETGSWSSMAMLPSLKRKGTEGAFSQMCTD